MSWKSIVVNIEKIRRKRLKFNAEHIFPRHVRDALKESCNNDVALGALLQNRFIILQRDEEGLGIIDLEEDDEIQSGDEIFMVAMNIVREVSLPVTESSAQSLEESVEVNSEMLEGIIEKENNLGCDTGTSRGVASPSINSNLTARTSIPKNYKLPQLTPELANYLAQGLLYKEQSEFITFWAKDLERLTNGKPSKLNYAAYATLIVTEYPILASPKARFIYSVVKGQLSSKFRNKRCYAKKKMMRASRAAAGANQPRRDEQPVTMEVDQCEQALEELKKWKKDDESENIKALLRLTFSYRQTANASKSILEIVQDFPQLAMFNLIMVDFFLRRPESNDESFELATAETINKLSSFFSFPAESEVAKIELLLKLEDKLRPHKYKNLNEFLFVSKPAGNGVTDLLSAATSSPRAVLYHKAGSIAQAFIVAGSLTVDIPDPTVFRVLRGLIACYYVWNVEYPAAYTTCLSYLDQEILKTQQNKAAVVKFSRDVEHAISQPASQQT